MLTTQFICKHWSMAWYMMTLNQRVRGSKP